MELLFIVLGAVAWLNWAGAIATAVGTLGFGLIAAGLYGRWRHQRVEPDDISMAELDTVPLPVSDEHLLDVAECAGVRR